MRKIVPVLLVVVALVVGAAVWMVMSGGSGDGGGGTGPAPVDTGAPPEDDTTSHAAPDEPSRRWEPSGPGSVVGVLRAYGSDEPLANVEVTLEAGLPGPNEVIRVATADDGSFRIAEAINFDEWTLRAKAPAPMAELVMGGVEVVEDQETDLGIIYVTPAYEIPGIVVDELGEPVAGATVRALRPRATGGAMDFLRLIRELPMRPPSVDAATTDTRGEFTLTKLPPGRYDFELSGPTHALRIERGVHVSPDTAGRPLRFVLTTGHELSGRVVRPAGGSVEGLQVVAFEEPRGEAGLFRLDKSFAVTDEEGGFRLKGLAAGTYVVVAVPEGQPFAIEDDVPVPGTDFVEIVLRGDCFLEGRIADDEERPIPDAEIYVVGFDRGNPSVGNAVADAEGRYRIDGLQSGPVQFFIVQAAGYASYPDDLFKVMQGGRRGSDLTLQPGPNERDVTLSMGGTVTGVVLEQGSEEPIEGARVTVLSAASFFGGSKGATTDAEGRFEITGLPKGPAILMAEKDGYFQPGANPQSIGMMMMSAMRSGQPAADSGHGMQISVTQAGERLERELKLAPGSTLKGVVLTPEGEPVAGAEVSLEQETRGMFGQIVALMGTSQSRLTSADGTFEMPGPAPGTSAAVVARSQGWLEGRTDPVTAKPGDVVEGIEVRLRQGATVEGVIRDSRGKAVAGALVRWTNNEPGRNEWEVRWALRRADASSSAADGRFRIAGVEPGPIVLQVTHPEHPSVSKAGVTAEDGKAVTVDLALPEGGEITGEVKLPNGRPAAGARVNIGREDGWETEQDAFGRNPEAASVDSEGKFRFRGLPGGGYSLTASAEGYADSATVAAAPGGAPLTLQLATAFVISGTVRYADGRPATGVSVAAFVRQNENTAQEVESTQTNAAGDFVLRDVPAGTYEVHVEQTWWGGAGEGVVPRVVKDVQAGQQGLLIEVSAGLSISGKVFLADGSAASEGWCSANRIPQPGEVDPQQVNRSGPIADGAFELKGLLPGKYRVTVNPGGTGSRTVEAEAGATDVVVRFTEGARISGRVTGPDGTGIAGVNVFGGGVSATTDENGRYAMSGAEPGTYQLAVFGRVDGKNYGGQSEQLTVADGDDRSGVDIAAVVR